MINKVILIGHLGADPETRHTQAGKAVCSFRMATTDRRKDQSGQYVEQTEWHNIVAWERQAENCQQYLVKGSKVYVEGKLQTRKWQDQNGNDRYTTEIIAHLVQFLSERPPQQQPYGQQSGQQRPYQSGQQQPGGQPYGQQRGGMQKDPAYEDNRPYDSYSGSAAPF